MNSSERETRIMEPPPPLVDESLHSICITNFNSYRTVRQSIDSILSQLNGRFEVVVVDQDSSDGSYEILKEYEEKGLVRLYRQSIRNRGRGRQRAFQESKGGYVVSNMDMDDIFEPRLMELIELYHAKTEGNALRVSNELKHGALTIAPRSLLEKIGGWKELNYVEDRYVWGRACMIGKYQWTVFPIYRNITYSREKRTLSQRAGRVYGIMRDRAKIGAPPRYKWFTLPILALALISARLTPTFRDQFFKDFWPDDPRYYVKLD